MSDSSSLQNTNSDDTDARVETDGVPDLGSDTQSTDTLEAQSLIAVARPDDAAQAKHAISYDDSELQATLMGNYGGTLPCTFCDDVDVTLNLFADSTVLKTSVYNNPETPRAPLMESGIYRQDIARITIVYHNQAIESYQIQDNHLLMIDENQNVNHDHRLSRQ